MDEAIREAFKRDGAVLIKGVLNDDDMQRCRAAFDWAVANPGPYAAHIYDGHEQEGFSDNVNPLAKEQLEEMMTTLPLGRMFADLWGSQNVWYFAEEVFLKAGGKSGRTPWHQDTSYLPWAGAHWGNAWISFEALPKQNSLEIIRGSHRGTQYDGITFRTPDDPTEPLFGGDILPRVPNIDAELAVDPTAYDVLSWATEPGDVVVLHPRCLHGGGAVDTAFPERRTIVFRCFGDDATFRPLPSFNTKRTDGKDDGLRTADFGRNGGIFVEEMKKLNDGDPFRSPIFRQLV